MKKNEMSNLTKQEIAKTLKTLMKSQPFNKITVGQICSLCSINRRTFYYHFVDKYDLLKWIVKTEVIAAVRSLTVTKKYEQAGKTVIDYIEKNRRFLANTYRIIGRDEFRNLLYDDFYKIVEILISSLEFQQNLFLEKNYKAFLTKHYTQAFAQCILQSLSSKKSENEINFGFISDIFNLSVNQIIKERGIKNEQLQKS